MSLRKVDEKYIESLNERELQLEQKIHQREEEQKRASRVFQEHVKK